MQEFFKYFKNNVTDLSASLLKNKNKSSKNIDNITF